MGFGSPPTGSVRRDTVGDHVGAPAAPCTAATPDADEAARSSPAAARSSDGDLRDDGAPAIGAADGRWPPAGTTSDGRRVVRDAPDVAGCCARAPVLATTLRRTGACVVCCEAALAEDAGRAAVAAAAGAPEPVERAAPAAVAAVAPAAVITGRPAPVDGAAPASGEPASAAEGARVTAGAAPATGAAWTAVDGATSVGADVAVGTAAAAVGTAPRRGAPDPG